MSRTFIGVVTALLLASCGKVADLEPRTGNTLPPKPALAKATPDAKALLELPPQAAPQRVDELSKRGEPRKPDRFDLPPASGTDAPQESAQRADDEQDQPQ